VWNDKNRHLIITLFQVDLPFKRLHCRVFPLRGCVTAKNIDSSVSNEVTGKNFSSPPANPVNRDMVSAQTKMIRKKKAFWKRGTFILHHSSKNCLFSLRGKLACLRFLNYEGNFLQFFCRMIKKLLNNLFCFKNYSEVILTIQNACIFFHCGVRATAKACWRQHF